MRLTYRHPANSNGIICNMLMGHIAYCNNKLTLLFTQIKQSGRPVCYLIFMFLSSAEFLKINFFKKLFQNTIIVSNNLDPDQAWRFVDPDLGPNCLQMLWAGGK